MRLLILFLMLVCGACTSTGGHHPLLSFFAPRAPSEAPLGHGLLKHRLAELCAEIAKEEAKEHVGTRYHAASPAVQKQIDELLKESPKPITSPSVSP
jgi:hypothetical protein